MPIIKSFAVGNGDMFYIRHGNDNFTMIDCNLTGDRDDEIIADIKAASAGKNLSRFISTHPDQDHFSGIEKLDAKKPIVNFYVVKNQATKADETDSFKHYRKLHDDPKKAFYIHKGCSRKWMTKGDEERGGSGVSILWPDTNNQHFKDALAKCEAGEDYNNTSAVIRYGIDGGASAMWLGDLHTDFMDAIFPHITLQKTTIVFAAHHGRDSGKIPNTWLWELDPQIIVLGEAPHRHLNYYTGYHTLKQNSAGDLTFHLEGNKVHICASNSNYSEDYLVDEYRYDLEGYIGTLTLDTGYTR